MKGFRKPFPIQASCIPAILEGRDVMGCAETGSGKTAAFALPILQKLSEDPYGIFAVILTPTRELAIQINEQFQALGVAAGVRTALIIGGENIIQQSINLSKRPHIIIATPGRLRHHIESADPPFISRVRFLVLDEADRLLSTGFESELQIILSNIPKTRQTLLFSATLNETLIELETLAMKNTLRFDLTTEQKIPTRLRQEYLFMPSQVKLCYLVAFLRMILQSTINDDEDENNNNFKNKKSNKSKNKFKKFKKNNTDDDIISQAKANLELQLNSSTSTPSSIIIFTSTCKRCQETCEILNQLNIDCVALHSMLTQNRRLAALGKFKSQTCRILVATDLAGRGLDIPHVDIVINFDIPKIASDYVHRIGRTARAGRIGRSLSLVTQYDIELIHNIEEYTNIKMILSNEIKEDDIRDLLNPISKAIHASELKMNEIGFDDRVNILIKRRRKQRRQVLRKNNKMIGSNSNEE
eukprot:gene3043-5961_t